MNDHFKPVAYIKEGCPYSMKLLSFMEEAQLLDKVELVRCEVGTPAMSAVRQKLQEATGESAKFPTVEIEPGQFRTESSELIDYFCERYETANPGSSASS